MLTRGDLQKLNSVATQESKTRWRFRMWPSCWRYMYICSSSGLLFALSLFNQTDHARSLMCSGESKRKYLLALPGPSSVPCCPLNMTCVHLRMCVRTRRAHFSLGEWDFVRRSAGMFSGKCIQKATYQCERARLHIPVDLRLKRRQWDDVKRQRLKDVCRERDETKEGRKRNHSNLRG